MHQRRGVGAASRRARSSASALRLCAGVGWVRVSGDPRAARAHLVERHVALYDLVPEAQRLVQAQRGPQHAQPPVPVRALPLQLPLHRRARGGVCECVQEGRGGVPSCLGRVHEGVRQAQAVPSGRRSVDGALAGLHGREAGALLVDEGLRAGGGARGGGVTRSAQIRGPPLRASGAPPLRCAHLHLQHGALRGAVALELEPALHEERRRVDAPVEGRVEDARDVAAAEQGGRRGAGGTRE